jgi:hypothetical protein
MIAHVVLFRPKAGLSSADRSRLLGAMREAQRAIPQIRRFIVGARVKNGSAYEAGARDFPFFAQFEFDSRDDLAAYLTHPAHEQLALGFYQLSDAAEAYDYAVGEMPEGLASLGLLNEH